MFQHRVMALQWLVQLVGQKGSGTLRVTQHEMDQNQFNGAKAKRIHGA